MDLVSQVQAIFEYDADPNTLNEAGDTLLHLAIRAKNQDIVDLLLNVPGINVFAQNRDGETPIVLAIKLGNRSLAQKIHSFTCPAITTSATSIKINYNQNLGGGKFGSVYKGVFGNEEVAVKIPHRGNESILLKEIAIMQKFRSPYIVDVKAVSLEQKSPKLALEYMDCGDLRRYLDDKRDKIATNLTVSELEVAWVVANALADLHLNGALHRDIKSPNIFLSTKHYIKVGDLGISREFTPSTMTQAGTPYWEAPEVIKAERYDYAADVYSFGVVLTELDTKELPYANLQLRPMEIMSQITRGSLRPSLRTSCEPWFEELANKCLSYNPEQRPTAIAIVEILLSQLHQSPKIHNQPALERDFQYSNSEQWVPSFTELPERKKQFVPSVKSAQSPQHQPPFQTPHNPESSESYKKHGSSPMADDNNFDYEYSNCVEQSTPELPLVYPPGMFRMEQGRIVIHDGYFQCNMHDTHLLQDENNSDFIVYVLECRWQHKDTQNPIYWKVSHRFDEFKKLHKGLKSVVPSHLGLLPKLPKYAGLGRIFGRRTSNSDEAIRERKFDLEWYIKAVVELCARLPPGTLEVPELDDFLNISSNVERNQRQGPEAVTTTSNRSLTPYTSSLPLSEEELLHAEENIAMLLCMIENTQRSMRRNIDVEYLIQNCANLQPRLEMSATVYDSRNLAPRALQCLQDLDMAFALYNSLETIVRSPTQS